MVSNQKSTDIRPQPEIALAFVGVIVPDTAEFWNAAFNRAGNMFQENLLSSLANAGLSSSLILSQRPLRSFPRSRIVWSSGGHVSLANGLRIDLVPFPNLSVLRPLVVGLMVLIMLIRWGWQQRNAHCRVVCTYNLTEPPGLFTLIGTRLIRAKAVAAVIDINVPGETVPATVFRRLDFLMQKYLIPRFDGLIVVSKSIVKDFAPAVPHIRIEGGVREIVLQRISNGAHSLGGSGAPFTVVVTGTLNETNGIREILESFSMISGDDYRLRIAGTGPLEDMVKNAAKIDPRIEYCGYLPFEQVLDLYDSADVLINMRLTQRLHTAYFFPSKMMEYLASGVPVITTCTGHVEEEYADIAFLLRNESSQGLATMIEYVASLAPEVRAQKGKVAREYMQGNSTWEAQGYRVAEFILDQVVNALST